MKKTQIILALVLLGLVPSAVFAQQKDKTGCQDPALFPTRMPNYTLVDCKTEEFGIYEFYATKGPKIPVEGKFTYIAYMYTGPQNGEPSGLAVVRNYENAIKSLGGTIVGTIPTWWVNAKIIRDGKEVWAQAEKGNGRIWIRIVEKAAMEQYVTADAAAFANDIRTAGHTAVYGILFDTGKSDIKPESAAAIGEVAKLLKGDAGLKIHIVGHTDNVGGIATNIKLSQDRAQAVLQSLVKDHGIAAARLTAYGCGQYAPVASNDTEEGRAKNRRVELVKQ